MSQEDPIAAQPTPPATAEERESLAAGVKPGAAHLHIEVLDRRARLRTRSRVDELPCIIGRAYRCGLVVDDPFVSGEHAAIRCRPDGTVVVEDLGSTNGMFDAGSGKRVDSLEIGPGTTVRIGQTLLRFHTANDPVKPALPLPRVSPTPLWAAPLAFAAALGLLSMSTYLETYSKMSPGPFVFGAVALAVVGFSWAGTWALLSRVLQQQAYLAEHCVVFCIFVCLYILSSWVTDYYAFAFSADRSASLLEWLVPIGLTTGILYGHLRFCSTLSSRQLLLRAAGVAGGGAALAGLLVFAESLDPDWTAMASYRGGLKPPSFRMVSSEDVDSFFSRVEQLKTRVDEVADLDQ